MTERVVVIGRNWLATGVIAQHGVVGVQVSYMDPETKRNRSDWFHPQKTGNPRSGRKIGDGSAFPVRYESSGTDE